MSRLGTLAFVDDQGHHCEFTLYPMDAQFKAGHAGVYFVTRRGEGEHGHHAHHKIFVGETADLASAFVNHPKQAVFVREGANCVAVHATQDAHVRARIVADLIRKFNPPGNAD